MRDIPDDPIIRCAERTGYPPWLSKPQMDYHLDEWEEDEEESDTSPPDERRQMQNATADIMRQSGRSRWISLPQSMRPKSSASLRSSKFERR